MKTPEHYTGQYVKQLIANQSGHIDENLTPIIAAAQAEAFKEGQLDMQAQRVALEEALETIQSLVLDAAIKSGDKDEILGVIDTALAAHRETIIP